MWAVCITSINHVLKLNGYGRRQAKVNGRRLRFKGWETLVNDFTNGLASGILGGYATAPNYSDKIKSMFYSIVRDYKKQISIDIDNNNSLIMKYQSEIIETQKSKQGYSNSDMMKLKQKIAVLNNANNKLKNDLKELNRLK